MDPAQIRRGWTLPKSLSALQYPNYRLFISGQIVSLTGAWIQNTALSWLVYNLLTQSSFYLGLLNFAAQIPILILGLVAGAVADSTNRRRLLIWTESLFMLESFALAWLTLTHNIDGIPLITFGSALGLATFSGVLHAFDLPARQAFLLEMVPRHQLQNAIALNSLTFNCARIIGPSIAGVLIAQMGQLRPNQKGFGEGMCFLIGALSISAVLYSLFRMNIKSVPSPPVTDSRFKYLTDGFRYVRHQPHVRALMLHLMAMAFFGIPYLIIMPVYAREVLLGSANVYGSLMTAVGIGAVCGGVLMTRRRSIKGMGSHMSRCVFGFTLALLLLSFNSSFVIALGLLAIAGFFMVMAMIGSQTLVQTLIPEDIRGRVMSIYTMISVGCLPLGSLLSGAVAEQYGVRWMLAGNAVICALSTTYFTWRLPVLRKHAMATSEYRAAIGAD